MARLIVMHDTEPELFVELTQDNDGWWEGPCSNGDFTTGGGRLNGLQDAVEVAILHLDHEH